MFIEETKMQGVHAQRDSNERTAAPAVRFLLLQALITKSVTSLVNKFSLELRSFLWCGFNLTGELFLLIS